jgi:hypothetical protein
VIDIELGMEDHSLIPAIAIERGLKLLDARIDSIKNKIKKIN